MNLYIVNARFHRRNNPFLAAVLVTVVHPQFGKSCKMLQCWKKLSNWVYSQNRLVVLFTNDTNPKKPTCTRSLSKTFLHFNPIFPMPTSRCQVLSMKNSVVTSVAAYWNMGSLSQTKYYPIFRVLIFRLFPILRHVTFWFYLVIILILWQ